MGEHVGLRICFILTLLATSQVFAGIESINGQRKFTGLKSIFTDITGTLSGRNDSSLTGFTVVDEAAIEAKLGIEFSETGYDQHFLKMRFYASDRHDISLGTGGNLYKWQHFPSSGVRDYLPDSFNSHSHYVDDVFQVVFTKLGEGKYRQCNNDIRNDGAYFIHQAGTYNLTNQHNNGYSGNADNFYSPVVAYELIKNPSNKTVEIYTLSWPQQSHMSHKYASNFLILSRITRVTGGTLRIETVNFNFGSATNKSRPDVYVDSAGDCSLNPVSGVTYNDKIDFVNPPWGGVRRSTLTSSNTAIIDDAFAWLDSALNVTTESPVGCFHDPATRFSSDKAGNEDFSGFMLFDQISTQFSFGANMPSNSLSGQSPSTLAGPAGCLAGNYTGRDYFVVSNAYKNISFDPGEVLYISYGLGANTAAKLKANLNDGDLSHIEKAENISTANPVKQAMSLKVYNYGTLAEMNVQNQGKQIVYYNEFRTGLKPIYLYKYKTTNSAISNPYVVSSDLYLGARQVSGSADALDAPGRENFELIRFVGFVKPSTIKDMETAPANCLTQSQTTIKNDIVSRGLSSNLSAILCRTGVD